jgi:hypothetical protein
VASTVVPTISALPAAGAAAADHGTLGVAGSGVNSAPRSFGVANTPAPGVNPAAGIVSCGATGDAASPAAPMPAAARTPTAIAVVIIVRLTIDIVLSFPFMGVAVAHRTPPWCAILNGDQ